MAGVQRFFANDTNLLALPASVITTDNVRSATGTVIRGIPDRQGFGRITIAGTYTGSADTDIDIEITSGAGDSVRVSQPIFIGAGNGTISDISGLLSNPQAIKIRLVSTGTTTTSARLELGDIALVAKVAGDDGNGIALTITPSLTLGTAIGALPASVSVAQSSWTGAEWDWGAPALLADGTLPSAAPRVAFGGDTSSIYRIYKRFIGGTWTYYVTPAISKAVPAGAAVQPVTGDYDVTLTKDATEEDFEGVTTLYDLARAFENSTLVTVEGVIVDDRAPGGLGVLDVSYRTLATARVTSRNGSKTLMDASLIATAAIGAVSQIVSVECTDNTVVGSETWSVVSDVGETLGQATSGREFSDAVVFTIPQAISESDPLGVVLTNMSYADRPDGEREPTICLKHGTQGAKAQTRTISLVYTAPPIGGCDCNYAQVSGLINPEILGLEEIDMSTWDPEYESRITDIADYLSDFVSAQTEIIAPSGTVPTAIWNQSADYSTPTNVLPETPNGHYYEVTWDGEVEVVYGGTDPVTATVWIDMPRPASWPTSGDTVTVQVSNVAVQAIAILGITTYNSVTPTTLSGSIKDMGQSEYYMAAAKNDIDIVYLLVGLLADNLSDIWSNATALAMWDALWLDMQVDLDPAKLAGSVSDAFLEPAFIMKYEARIDAIRVRAGLLPKKFKASTEGSSVWQDHADQYRWVASDGYLPWFDNEIGYTAKMIEGIPTSTQEACFALACACPELLIAGDTATVDILSRTKTYAVGDKFTITVSGGQTLSTAGGVTGDDTLVWSVQGTVDTFDDYSQTLLEPLYEDNGLEFRIERGAVDFAVGDEFNFVIEPQGEYRWRRDSGAWSASADTGDGDLVDGLTIAFTAGIAPAFVDGDIFSFSVVQPYAVDHLVNPLPLDESYQWSGADTEIAIDLGSDKTLTAIGLLIHTIPSGATISLNGGSTAEALDWTETITWRAGPIVTLFAAAHTCRYLILNVQTATGGSIGWLWLGQPLQLSKHAIRCELRREHLITRSSGAIPTARSLGDGWAGELEFEYITQTDIDLLLALWDGVKAGGDEPIGFLPHHLHPDETVLVGLAGDSLPLTDYFSYQPNSDTKRRLSCTLPLRAIPQ